jgi:hypothetical protein
MLTNLKFAEDLANNIFSVSGDDGKDAFLKTVCTLAHIIYVSTEEAQREEMILVKLPCILGEYLVTLDTVNDEGVAKEQRH